MRMVPKAFLWLPLLAAGCHPGEKDGFGGNGHRAGMDSVDTGEADSDVDSDTDADTDTNGDSDSDSETGGDDSGLLDAPGDVETWSSDAESAVVDLTDASSDESNQDADFYVVIVNSGEADLGYQLWYTNADAAARPSVTPPKHPRSSPRSRSFVPAHVVPDMPVFETVTPYAEGDIGIATQEFHVRDDMDHADSYAVVDATLWAIGTSVAIWVDNDAAIDWDYTCDGVVDEIDPRNAYGFDNCDLGDIATIVDANIYANLTTLFGVPSDVNGDGRVTVLITPVLNAMPRNAEDPDVRDSIVASYADPAVDLSPYDPTSNPGSNEQEVIYVFAPDPNGYYNAFHRTSVEEYTSMSLAGQTAQMLEHLISYNYHVISGESTPEESWVDAGLGTLAADLTGFGAVFYAEAWDYLDAPYLYALTSMEDSGEVVPTAPKGAQYLFFRWLVDVWGTSVLADLTQTTDTGVTNVENAVSTVSGGTASMNDLVLQWQIAMLTTGITQSDGSTALVDATDWPPFAAATIIDAPPESPGSYYGANGYQMGLNLNGDNLMMTGGTTDSPTESVDDRVRLGNTDHLTYVPGFNFFGYISSNYGAQVVRISHATYDATLVNMAASGTDYYGAAVRWPDPAFQDVAVEEIFSPTDANAMDLPPISLDAPVYAVGEISEEAPVSVLDASGLSDTMDVRDTDRWRLDLSDRPNGEAVCMLIWLDRHAGNAGGDPAPFDPWFAVLPERDLITPTVEAYSDDECPGALDFGYPYTVLDYLYYQVFLADDPFDGAVVESGEDTGDPAAGAFDPCGQVNLDTGLAPECSTDWDQDGVTDEDEPRPTTFLEQIWVQQCTMAAAAGTPAAYYDNSIFDVNTVDPEEATVCDRVRNAGGLSSDSGQEAFMEVVLDGGETYIAVVGGTGDVGVYEMTFQQVDCDAS
jgi:hypothetical protein